MTNWSLHKTQDPCATNNTQIYGELTAHTNLIVQMGMGTGKLYTDIMMMKPVLVPKYTHHLTHKIPILQNYMTNR